MRVGPGATWGAILETLKPLGMVPAVTVTTENATAGGTLSGDCLSRFSPSYGKEGEWIQSFDLLTPEGELITCTPPAKDQLPSTKQERVFCGTIGGLGYLGAVVSITYRVMPVGGRDDEIAVRTIVRKFDTFGDLAADLVPTAKRTYLEDSDPTDPEKLDAIWSALDTRGDETKSALFFTSTFAATRTRRRMALHRPKLLLRILVEWLMRVPFFSKLMWRFYVRFLFKDGDEYLDDLEGFSFFMDGNARAKRIGKKLGFKMQNAQQTFIVPSDPGAEGGWDRAADDLVEWLEFAHDFLLERDLTPTLNDVLFVPRDRPVPALGEQQPARVRGQLRVRDLEPGRGSSAPRQAFDRARRRALGEIPRPRLPGQERLCQDRRPWRRCTATMRSSSSASSASSTRTESSATISSSGPSASCSTQVVLTTRTEQLARWVTVFGTLPRTRRCIPLLPITSRSAPHSSAS